MGSSFGGIVIRNKGTFVRFATGWVQKEPDQRKPAIHGGSIESADSFLIGATPFCLSLCVGL